MENQDMFKSLREAYRAKHGKFPRILDGDIDCNCKTIVNDNPGTRGACCKYIMTAGPDYIGYVKFQEGLVSENGINGCLNENLLSIVMDRLEGFQSGNYACIENVKALDSVRAALTFLKLRTSKHEKGA